MEAWCRNIFLKSLNEFDPSIKFTFESNKQSIAFLDIKIRRRNGKVFTDVYVKRTDHHQYLHYLPVIHTTLKSQLSLVRCYELVGYSVLEGEKLSFPT